jgi:hypothetical protein
VTPRRQGGLTARAARAAYYSLPVLLPRGMGVVGRVGSPVLVVLIALAPGELAAQAIEVHADGSVSVGISRSSQAELQVDPLGEPPDSANAQLFTELRPSFALQSTLGRMRWGVGYQFGGRLTADSAILSYSNQADAQLVGELTQRTSLAAGVAVAQGSATSLVGLVPADTAAPTIRAPGNQSRLTLTAGEQLGWEVAPTTTLRQTLRLTANAPQDDLDQSSSDAAAALALEKVRRRTLGALEIRSRIARLRPLQAELEPFSTLTNSAVIRGSHDLSPRWHVEGTLGIEQVYANNNGKPLALLPTAGVLIDVWTRSTNVAMEVSRSVQPNLEVGTIAVSNRVGFRGLVMFDEMKMRALRFSVGGIHNEPLGQYDVLAVGTMDALQADIGVTTAINSRAMLFARYAANHQFDQMGMLPSTTTHVFLVGASAYYSSTGKPRRALPATGRRVDNGDGVPAEDGRRQDLDGEQAPQ